MVHLWSGTAAVYWKWNLWVQASSECSVRSGWEFENLVGCKTWKDLAWLSLLLAGSIYHYGCIICNTAVASQAEVFLHHSLLTSPGTKCCSLCLLRCETLLQSTQLPLQLAIWSFLACRWLDHAIYPRLMCTFWPWTGSNPILITACCRGQFLHVFHRWNPACCPLQFFYYPILHP